MSHPGNYEFDASDWSTVALPTEIAEAELREQEIFDEFIEGERQGLFKEERRRRAASFDLAHTAVQEWSATFNGRPTFHKTYVERDGLPIERRAVVQPINFPGLGRLTRLVVNDEGPDETEFSTRRNDIRDYLLSNCGKAFSWQYTSLSRPREANAWGEMVDSGPLIRQRSTDIDVVQGTNYATFLPRIGGYRTSLYESIERRHRLDEFTEILGSLGVATYEPGFEVKPFF